MPDILKVTTPLPGSENTNRVRTDAPRQEQQVIQTVTDPTRVTQANAQDVYTEREAGKFMPNYESNYEMFLELLRNYPDAMEEIRTLVFSKMGQMVSSGIETGMAEELATFMQMLQMDEGQLLKFVKEQLGGAVKFKGPFFDLLREVVNRSNSPELRQAVVNFLKSYDSMASTPHILRELLANLESMAAGMPKSMGDQLRELIAQLPHPPVENGGDAEGESAGRAPDGGQDAQTPGGTAGAEDDAFQTMAEALQNAAKATQSGGETQPAPGQAPEAQAQAEGAGDQAATSQTQAENAQTPGNAQPGQQAPEAHSRPVATQHIANGQTGEALTMIRESILPFLSRYMTAMHDFGPVRDFITMFVLNTTRFEAGSMENFQQAVENLLSFDEIASRLPDIDPDALVRALVNSTQDTNELATQLAKIIARGMEGGAGVQNKSMFENIVRSILVNESVYMPLLHAMIPAEIAGTLFYSEVWVDPDAEEGYREEPYERAIKMLVKFDIKNVGCFELVLLHKGNELDIQLFSPPHLLPFEKQISKAVAEIAERNDLHIGSFAQREAAAPLIISEVFPKLYERKNAINVVI